MLCDYSLGGYGSESVFIEKDVVLVKRMTNKDKASERFLDFNVIGMVSRFQVLSKCRYPKIVWICYQCNKADRRVL